MFSLTLSLRRTRACDVGVMLVWEASLRVDAESGWFS
jgi:hypothetical protein